MLQVFKCSNCTITQCAMPCMRLASKAVFASRTRELDSLRYEMCAVAQQQIFNECECYCECRQ